MTGLAPRRFRIKLCTFASSGRGLFVTAVCLLLSACHPRQERTEPFIEFTKVPRAAEGNPYRLVTIEGRVAGARPGQQIVLYARSGAWWVQPLADQPYTRIQPDSTWKNSTHPGTEYAALLVEPGYRPPTVAIVLPSVGDGVVGAASVGGEPVFWQTWWFRACAGLAVAALAFAAYRWRLGNIEERERQFRKLAENAPDIVMRFDSELRCRYVNPIVEEYTGLRPAALLGRPISEVSAFKKRDRYWEASLRQVFETGKAATRDFTFDTPKGERHFESRIVPEGGTDAVARSVLVVTRDVTDSKRAEEALRTSEQTFRLMVESIPGLVSSTNAAGEIEIANQQLLKYVGKTLEELKDWHMLVHPDDVASVAVRWNCSIETGDPYDDEYRLRRADSVYRWFHVRGLPLRNKEGHIVRWYVLITDVDERKKADERVQRSEAYLAEGQRLAHTGSWAWNVRTRDAFWSEEMFRILGFDPEITKPTLSEFLAKVHPEDRQRIERKAQMESAGVDEDAEADFRVVLADGTIKHLHSVARLMRNEMGEVTEVVGTTMDVTDRKQAEDERERLRQAQADLARVARVTTMGELTASLAHEINQPIAAAITNSNTCLRWLTRDPPDVEEAREAASRIAKDATRAADIIRRIRLLFQKGAPQQELVDVNEVIREMMVLLGSEADRCLASIRADLATDLPKVMADHVQLQQVFTNLMLNGIEAMKDAGTLRELTIKSERASNSHLLISVSDTGVGLAPRQTDEIFNPFYSTKPNGIGMGLAISRSIIESHGGRLWATANNGPGATFHFTLPSEVEVRQ